MKAKTWSKAVRCWNLKCSIAIAGITFLFSISLLGQSPQVLHGHVPAIVKSLKPIGNLSQTNSLNLAISLPLRNQSALDELLKEIYNPASPNYHHYLTPQQFTEKFGPTESDYQKVIAFAKSNGLKVTATHPNRMILDVSAPVANLQRALHVTMHTYRHPTENRNFFAPDTEPSLDLTVPVLHISGLNNYSLPHPRYVINPKNKINAAANDGSGPDNGFMGNDFRKAYVPGTALTGAGQTVALLQFDGYDSNDIAYYENQAGLAAVSLTNVLIDGASGNPTSDGQVEVCLDVEMAISMAPALSEVILYIAPNPSPFEDILNRMVTDDSAQQISCSWSESNGISNAVTDQIFQQMAAQGQSFFNASGDSDAYTGLIDFPGDSPYITQVGGTSLTTDGTGAWSSESVWNWGAGRGSGGGISTQYPIPSWQTNINMAFNQGSTTWRNIPDVALTADNIYVRAKGLDYNLGGTSAAAPLWAGFAALVNQRAAETGATPIGFINPALDIIASGSSYSSVFNDIINGDNTSGGSPTKFYAVSGYDLCTGWGTPKLDLIALLANPESLVIAPANGFASSGGSGGPFTVTSQNFSLTNVGTSALNWSLSNTSAWLNVSISNGTLTPGGSATTVSVSLNPVASNLTAGNYTATVQFTNLNDNVFQARQFSLSVISPPTITTQPTNQILPEGATAGFTVTADGGLPLTYQWQLNGTNLVDDEKISGAMTTNLIINNISSINVGTYTVTVTNFAGFTISSNALLSITSSPPIIITQPNNQTVTINNTASFAVEAIGTTPLFYQWSFNETNILNATNAILVLTNVQFNQAGDYAVSITNLIGSTNSTIATLAVNPLPSCAPAPSGLVGWWPAEGDASDIIGTNNGTLGSATIFTNGEVGQAFFFDGSSSSYVSIPDSPSLDSFSNSITIELWFKSNQTNANSDWQTIVSKGNAAWEIQATVYARTVTFTMDGPNPNSLDGTKIVNDGQWHHVAATYDGTNICLYVDGTLDASEASSGLILQHSYPMGIGYNAQGNGSPGYFYNGSVDEVSIYHRALSASEIQLIYLIGSAGKCPPPPTPPFITTQPINQTNFVGTTASFSVTANGTTPLFYQWSFNETNILNATNAILVLTNVQFNQAGDYAVSITNLIGSTNSTIATLAVNPLPSCAPAPSGLVGWWPAEGDASDIIGTNNGTLGSATIFTNGEVGQAFFFDGSSSSYVSIPDSPSLDSFSNSITIELWFKSNQTNANSDWQTIVSKGNAAWEIQATVYARTVTFTMDGPNPNSLDGTKIVNDGQWHHVAATYDGTNICLYVDGTLDASEASSGLILQHSYPMGIGYNAQGNGSPGYFYNGSVDEVSIYHRALSASEIQLIYAAGSGGKCSPMAPVIITQPTNQVISVGDMATFMVLADGTAPLAYQWNFDGANILNATNASLILTNVQMNQGGNYAVTVTNFYGSVLSSNATLVVNPLFHFVWNQIPSPRFADEPFAVVIQAHDLTNALATNFNGTVLLNSTNGIAITPTVSGNFIQGVWTGAVTVAQIGTNIVLKATDNLGDFGLANAINVMGVPSLMTTPSGSTLYISWPVSPSGFILEMSPDLSPGSWVPVSVSPIQIGGQNLEPITISGTNAFYRLHFNDQ